MKEGEWEAVGIVDDGNAGGWDGNVSADEVVVGLGDMGDEPPEGARMLDPAAWVGRGTEEE